MASKFEKKVPDLKKSSLVIKIVICLISSYWIFNLKMNLKIGTLKLNFQTKAFKINQIYIL